MDSHQCHLIGTVFIIININCTEQRDVFKIIIKGDYRKISRNKFYTITYQSLSLHLLEHLVLLLLNKCLDTVEKFFDIGSPRLSLDTGIAFIEHQKSRLHRHGGRNRICIIF